MPKNSMITVSGQLGSNSQLSSQSSKNQQQTPIQKLLSEIIFCATVAETKMLVASLFGWYYHGYHACSCMACGNKLPFECEASHLTEAKIFRCNYSSSDICCSIENYNLRMRGAFGFICCSVVSYNDPGWNS